MTVTLARYKIHFASEKLLGRHPSCNCYLGCGVSTAWHGAMDASLGETGMTQTGKLKDKGERTNVLRRGWKAFKRVADSNGIPDTDDYIRIHRAMFPGYPDPERLWTRDFSDIVDLIDAGDGISIAVRLRVLPQDAPAARYTRADHQVYLQERVKGKDQFVDVDPMHGHSNTYAGHAVPFSDIRKASKAISGGTVLAWIYPRGGWTGESLARVEMKRRLRVCRIDRNEAEDDLEKAQRQLANARRRIVDLESQGPTDCDPVARDAVNDEMDALEVYASTRKR